MCTVWYSLTVYLRLSWGILINDDTMMMITMIMNIGTLELFYELDNPVSRSPNTFVFFFKYPKTNKSNQCNMTNGYWPSMDVTSAEPTGEVRRVRFGLSLRDCDQSIVILVHCIGEFMMTLCHCVIVIVTFSLWIENGWARRGGPPVNPTKLNLLTVLRFGWICFSPAF